MTPEPSYYAKQVLYRVHDVTGLLRAGANALGLTVGDGWYASFDDRYAFGPPPRRVLAQLELTYADGTREVIGSGPGWRISESSIRESQIRIGEVQDARLEQPGWDSAGFNDAHWAQAQLADTPSGRLTAQTGLPIRAVRSLRPRSVSQAKPGIYVFDFGENFSGCCRLEVRGPSGTRIDLRHAELLGASGEVDQPYGNTGKPKNDAYILRGAPEGETFEPHFAYRGFRYVQVSGLPHPPLPDTLNGVVIHTDLEKTGAIHGDSPIVEAIWQATVRTHDSNLMGLPTDTPGREQRPFA